MKCNFIRSYLKAHQFAEPDEAAKMHLQDCRECREFYKQYGQFMQLLEEKSLVRENPFLRAKILDSVYAPRSLKSFNLYWIAGLRYSIAGLATLFLIASGVLLGTKYTDNRGTNHFTDETEKYYYYSEIFYLNELHVEQMENIILTNDNP